MEIKHLVGISFIGLLEDTPCVAVGIAKNLECSCWDCEEFRIN